MTCVVCGGQVAFVDDRPGANPVGWCNVCFPAELHAMATQLAVGQRPLPVTPDGPQPTQAVLLEDAPTPLAHAREAVAGALTKAATTLASVGEAVAPADHVTDDEAPKPKKTRRKKT